MQLDIQMINQIAGRIKGFLDPDEGMRLFDTALKASLLGPSLEIGSYCGKSAIYLGTACKIFNTILFSIDHHRGSEEQQPGEEYFDPELFDGRSYQIDAFHEFRKTLNLAGLESTVVPLIANLNSGMLPVVEKKTLSIEQQLMETVFLGLRTIEGISIRRFEEKSAKPFNILFQDILTDPELKKLITQTPEHCSLTFQGMMVLDSIACMFVDRI